MLSYKDVEFTDDLIQEISATVGRATDEAVLAYVRAHKDLSKGFQIKKNSCAVFRKKMASTSLRCLKWIALPGGFLARIYH